jgi:hypothetical protein
MKKNGGGKCRTTVPLNGPLAANYRSGSPTVFDVIFSLAEVGVEKYI